jgi:hypothetical protein
MPDYAPIALDVTMSQYGYWVVTYSIKPGLRMSVMICKIGITQQEATALGLASVAATPAKG